ncbi:MAG TPA: hypothetical protein VGE88_19040 [Lysobacter sp.]
MSIEQVIGRLGKQSASELAGRAARIIVDAPRERAVCLAPDGTTSIESVAQAIPDELVGVYTKAPGLLALWRQIYDDLRAAITERGIGPHKRTRGNVYTGRKRKEAA